VIAALLPWVAVQAGAAAVDPTVAAEIDRLSGQRVTILAGGADYRIDDIAGEGAPLVGVVERRGDALWLVAGDQALRLAGPLAIPRIAGPGYKVWVLGERRGDTLTAHRIGVLRPPSGQPSAISGQPEGG